MSRSAGNSKFQTMQEPALRPSSGFLVALAVLLALVHAILAVTAARDKSTTVDEIAHLTAGLAYNTRGDYRLQPENGNLPQRWAALPAFLAGVELPAADRPDWQRADVWRYGHDFFYKQQPPAEWLLASSRSMVAIFSAATGLLIFFWSHALFGWRGAFLSLLFFVFSPTFLAHGALATSDTVMAFFFLASVGAWWRHLQRPGWTGAALSAATLGLATVAKFSALLLAPMFALIALAWLAGQRGLSPWRTLLARLARTTAVHLLVTWGVVWLFYGFRFAPFHPSLADGARYLHGWESLTSDLEGGWRTAIFAARDWHLLPDAFLYGFTFVLQFSKQRAAFLNGDYSFTGWTSFFPYAFLAKTTLGLLLASLAALAAWVVRLHGATARATARNLLPFAPLAALFVVYWAVSLTSHLNIGHRHLLPIYPVIFIGVGALGACLDRRHLSAAFLVVALLGAHIADSWLIRPHYLAYFNSVAGGPKNGWRHLVDSSLDWGQDLRGLRRWLETQPDTKDVYLSYFGTGDPGYEGISATFLPTLPDYRPPEYWHALDPGIYAISATMLQHVYSAERGPWSPAAEKEFQDLRPIEPAVLKLRSHAQGPTDPFLASFSMEQLTAIWKRYETLRFARLCHYLRAREPDATIGYSILVYRLSAAEIVAATQGSREAWEKLIADAQAAGRVAR